MTATVIRLQPARVRYLDRAARALARLPRMDDEQAAAIVLDSIADTLAGDPAALHALMERAALTDAQARATLRTLSTHLRKDL